MKQTLDVDMLRRIGEALYGAQWQSDLARDLDINGRVLRYWLAGERTAPSDTLDRLQQLIAARFDRLSALSDELQKKSETIAPS